MQIPDRFPFHPSVIQHTHMYHGSHSNVPQMVINSFPLEFSLWMVHVYLTKVSCNKGLPWLVLSSVLLGNYTTQLLRATRMASSIRDHGQVIKALNAFIIYKLKSPYQLCFIIVRIKWNDICEILNTMPTNKPVCHREWLSSLIDGGSRQPGSELVAL